MGDRPSRCYPENYANGTLCASCGRIWGEDGPEECPLEPMADRDALHRHNTEAMKQSACNSIPDELED